MYFFFLSKKLGRSNPILLRGYLAWLDLQGLQVLNYQIGFIFHQSHRFRTWSHQNPTRRFCTKQPKAVPNKLPVKTWCEVYDDLAPRYPSYEEHHDRDRTTDLLIPQNDTNCQRLLKSVTTATIGSGIHFSSRHTVFHREREMDCF